MSSRAYRFLFFSSTILSVKTLWSGFCFRVIKLLLTFQLFHSLSIVSKATRVEMTRQSSFPNAYVFCQEVKTFPKAAHNNYLDVTSVRNRSYDCLEQKVAKEGGIIMIYLDYCYSAGSGATL